MKKERKNMHIPAKNPDQGRSIEMPEDIFTPEGVLITSPLNIGRKYEPAEQACRKSWTVTRKG